MLTDSATSQQHVTEDGILDDIDQSLVRLKIKASDIGNEVEDQNNSLDDLKHNISNTQDDLTFTQSRLDKLLLRSKRCCFPYGIIIILTFILIILLLIVVYG